MSLQPGILKKVERCRRIWYTVWEAYLKGYYDEYPLWIRNVFTKPGSDIDWMFWQYTNRGRLEGYWGEEQYIDINVFRGDEDDWEKFSRSVMSE